MHGRSPCPSVPVRAAPHVRRIARALAAAALALMSAAVRADGVEGSLQYTSDYVLRGLSQTAGRGALQGGLQYDGRSAWFAGVWASSVVFDPAAGRKPEIDLYAGRAWQPHPLLTLRATALGYLYPRGSRELSYDYAELLLEAEFADRVTLAVAWSPNYSRFSSVGVAEHRRAVSYELSARQPLARRLSLTGSVGWQDLNALFGRGYLYGGVGLGWDTGPLALGLTRVQTDGTARRLFGDGIAGSRWAGTITWRF